MLSIILSRRDFREFDQMISLYTKERGKLELLARGVKKITSKNSAHLEPFCFVDATVEPGKELDHLIKVQPVEYFSAIRDDLEKSLAARSAVSITDILTQVGERDPKLFDALLGWLKFLSSLTIPLLNHPLLDKEGVRRSDGGGFAVVTTPTAKPPRPRPAGYAPPYQGGDGDIGRWSAVSPLLDGYIVQLLHCLGFTPVLDECVVCEKSFQQIIKQSLTLGLEPASPAGRLLAPGFYFAGGGLICPSCRTAKELIGEEIFQCSLKEVSDLALLLKGDWRRISEFELNEDEQKKLHRLVYEYAVYHSERKIADWGNNI